MWYYGLRYIVEQSVGGRSPRVTPVSHHSLGDQWMRFRPLSRRTRADADSSVGVRTARAGRDFRAAVAAVAAADWLPTSRDRRSGRAGIGSSSRSAARSSAGVRSGIRQTVSLGAELYGSSRPASPRRTKRVLSVWNSAISDPEIDSRRRFDRDPVVAACLPGRLDASPCYRSRDSVILPLSRKLRRSSISNRHSVDYSGRRAPFPPTAHCCGVVTLRVALRSVCW